MTGPCHQPAAREGPGNLGIGATAATTAPHVMLGCGGCLGAQGQGQSGQAHRTQPEKGVPGEVGEGCGLRLVQHRKEEPAICQHPEGRAGDPLCVPLTAA